jgi:hypothetical protein
VCDATANPAFGEPFDLYIHKSFVVAAQRISQGTIAAFNTNAVHCNGDFRNRRTGRGIFGMYWRSCNTGAPGLANSSGYTKVRSAILQQAALRNGNAHQSWCY